MKSKICSQCKAAPAVALAIALGLLSFGVVARAQDRGTRQLIVPLASGGYVAFKAETAAPENNASTPGSADRKTGDGGDIGSKRGVFDSQALVDENQIIHRLLVDTEGKPVFGYDLQVSPNKDLKQFKVAAGPLDADFANKLLAKNPGRGGATISTLPQSSESQLLDDGDAFALDLLVNPSTGIKIVDVVKVSFDRDTLWDINPKTLPRDFTLEEVQLAVKEYRLLINGKVVASGKPANTCSGALIWFYVPGHGRFIFSLVPRDGYPFQKVGIVAGNEIEFTVGRDRYQWISSAPVLRDGGAWNLWVLHDPDYTPLIAGPDQPSLKEKRPDAWDKINAAVKPSKTAASTFHTLTPKTVTKNGDELPIEHSRPMVGGADRIENLWPRN
jgi:hypothetical protein